MRALINFWIAVGAFIFPLGAHADSCQASCPNGRRPVTVCFMDPGAYRENPWIARANCGLQDDAYVVDDLSDLRARLSAIEASCNSIQRLTFAGHGNVSFHEAGSVDTTSFYRLRDYSCLFTQNAQIQFLSCLTGRGCRGDLFLQEAVQQLLPRGGTASAPTYYYNPLFQTGLNGQTRVVHHSPGSKPPYRWNTTGLAIDRSTPLQAHCIRELEDQISELENLRTREPQACPIPSEAILEPRSILTQLRNPEFLRDRDHRLQLNIACYQLSQRIQNAESCIANARTKNGIPREFLGAPPGGGAVPSSGSAQ